MPQNDNSPIIIETLDPRLRIMVSSTTVDLPDHRKEATDAIQRLGHTAVVMEHGSAEWNSDAIKFSLERVGQSQVYVGIFALRYGYIPEDAIRNPQRLSITELEYRHALAIGKPTLIFLAADTHPFTEDQIDFGPDERAKLKKLKEELKKTGIRGFFDSPAKLREEVFISLQRLQVQLIQPTAVVEATLPKLPELYAVPTYVLTNTFVGRSTELDKLDVWATSTDPIMVVEGIGGLGKSAVTWEWTINRSGKAIPTLAGRVWWSFYEKGTSMIEFVRYALAYVTGRSPDSLRKDYTPYQLGQQLLAELKKRPFLLVLDGFERVLTAYHRIDKAQIPDDRVDEKLRECVNPPDGELLTQLLKCHPSKILISTRLFPGNLEDPASKRPIDGVIHHHLNGLSEPDALEFIRHAGLKGNEKSMLEFAGQFGRHSLLLKVVCGMVADYRRNPYNFDAWLADPVYGGSLKLTELDLKNRYTHILEFALRGLGEHSRSLLCRIAVISENANYDTLAVLNPFLPPKPVTIGEPHDGSQHSWLSKEEQHQERESYPERLVAYRRYQDEVKAYYSSPDYRKGVTAFDAALKELEDRGLLHWDREANRYEMHPLIRAYAAELLESGERTETFDKVRNHFQALPPDDFSKATELAHVSRSLEIYRCFVGSGMLNEAAKFYRGDLARTLYVNVGAYTIILELLKPLFRNDLEGLPAIESTSDRGYILTTLMNTYVGLGQSDAALRVSGKALQLDLDEKDWTNLAYGLRNLRNALYNKSRRAEAVAALALARDLATAAGDADGVTLAIFYQMWDAIEQGRFEDAESLDAEYRQRPSPPEVYSRPGDVAFWRCYNLFQQGLLTEEDWGNGYDLTVKHRNVHMQFVFLGLHAEWNLERNRPDEVLDDVDQALQIANRVGASEREYHDLRAWALAKLGYHNESRAELNKGVYGRFAAEVYLVLGERSQVAWCARNTYRWAWGAGPPYIQWYDLERSKALLKQVGEAEPQLPPFDPTTVPPVPFETEIRAAIAELNAKKEKREKPDPAQ